MKKAQQAEIELGTVSIQLFETDPGPCITCGRQIGFGPVGFTKGEPRGPVCDGCLLALDKPIF